MARNAGRYGMGMEELDAAVYNTFGHLYQMVNAQKKVAFEEGGRRRLEALHHWILQRESQLTVEDIITYIENELGIASVFGAPEVQHPPSEDIYDPMTNYSVHSPHSLQGGQRSDNNTVGGYYSSERSPGYQDGTDNVTAVDHPSPEYVPQIHNQNSGKNSEDPSWKLHPHVEEPEHWLHIWKAI